MENTATGISINFQDPNSCMRQAQRELSAGNSSNARAWLSWARDLGNPLASGMLALVLVHEAKVSNPSWAMVCKQISMLVKEADGSVLFAKGTVPNRTRDWNALEAINLMNQKSLQFL